MEAVAIVSLFSNVLQFVKCAIEVGQVIQQTYRKGDSQRNIDVNSSANHLSAQSEELLNDLNSTTITATPTEKRLKDIGQECHQIALELVRKTQKLQAGNTSKLGAFTKGLRVAWKKGDIDKLVTRLQDHERLLNTAVLVDLRRQCDVSSMLQQKRFINLTDKQQLIIQNISDSQKHITDLVTNEGAWTRNSNKDSHQETQAVVKDGISTTTQLVVEGNSQVLALGVNLHSKHQQSVNSRQREQLLNSLYYPDMNACINRKALGGYPDTCDFIFTNKEPVSFSEWLEHGDGIFWIQGKAGSGKSTMMKFIFKNVRTRDHLATWASPRQPAILSFFFWLSGSAPQNTMHGFLCSLLYQLLQTDEVGIAQIIDHSSQSLTKKQPHDWSQKELSSQLKASIDRASQHSPILIMLDGLDELCRKENPRELLDVIATWVKHTKVKICVASRGENIFIRTFEGVPSVRLQDLNANSIQKYVRAELITIIQDKGGIFEVDKRIQNELVEEISSKACGVFMWVYIAVNDTLDALTDAADWSEIVQRVRALPPDIEKLYTDMLQRKQQNSALAQQEAALYFRLALYQPDSQMRFHLAIKDIHVYTAARKKWIQNEAPSCFEAYHEALSLKAASQRVLLRIRVVCAGLLEYASSSESINFFHRTARDFLLDSEAGQNILRYSGLTDFDISQTVLESAMLQYKLGFAHLSWSRIAFLGKHVSKLRLCDDSINKQSQIPVDAIPAVIPATAALFRCLELRIPEMLSAIRCDQEGAYKGPHTSHPSNGPACEYVIANENKHHSFFAIDFVGLMLELGHSDHFQSFWIPSLQAEKGRGIQLTQEYKDYLLFCVMKGVTRLSTRAADLSGCTTVLRYLLAAGARGSSLVYLPLVVPLRQCSAIEIAILLRNMHRESKYVPSRAELENVISSAFVSDADLRAVGLIGITSRGKMLGLDRWYFGERKIRFILEVNAIWILRGIESLPARLQALIDKSEAESFCQILGVRYLRMSLDTCEQSYFVNPPLWLENLIQPYFVLISEEPQPDIKPFVCERARKNNLIADGVWDVCQRAGSSPANMYDRLFNEMFAPCPRIDMNEKLTSLGHLKDSKDPLVPQGPIKRFEDLSADGQDMTERIAALRI